MQVRIQLIHDNGNVVLEAAGDATQPLVWATPWAGTPLVMENALLMSGFLYEPHISTHEWAEEHPNGAVTD